MAVRLFTLAERPELATHGILSTEVWPEYNLYGDVTNPLWPRLYEELPDFQFGLYDEDSDELLAEGHTIPCWWDGSEAGLSSGVDATLLEAFERLDSREPVNTLCALAAEIPPSSRGRGLATTIVEGMRLLADRADLGHLIAPVRPSWKDRYPITPIERYVRWRRADGMSFDPWMRVHERVGAALGPALPQSLRITGSVAEWEEWTGLAFPESGEYVFPQGLAPVAVDHPGNLGTYWEPNVWMLHRI